MTNLYYYDSIRSIKYIKKVARFKQENYGNLKRNLVGKEEKNMLENKTNKKIDKIRKEVEICRNIKNQENEIKCYEEKLNQEIKGDKYTFLVYSMEVEKELDLNFSAFWVSTLALIISCFFSVSSAIKEFYDNAGIKKLEI